MASCKSCKNFSSCNWSWQIGCDIERISKGYLRADDISNLCPQYEPKEATP